MRGNDDHMIGADEFEGGLLYYDGDSDLASLNPSMSAATLMLHYAPMATNSSTGDGYRVSWTPSRRSKLLSRQTFAQGQIDYLLGNNPMNGECPY